MKSSSVVCSSSVKVIGCIFPSMSPSNFSLVLFSLGQRETADSFFPITINIIESKQSLSLIALPSFCSKFAVNSI